MTGSDTGDGETKGNGPGGPASAPSPAAPPPPGPFGRLAGARCPACGGGLAPWQLMQTGRLARDHLTEARALPSMPCPACGAPVALGGSALWQRTALFAIVAPVTLAAFVVAVFAAVLLGFGDSALAILCLAGAILVLLPVVLSIRLLGVERRDVPGPAGED